MSQDSREKDSNVAFSFSSRMLSLNGISQINSRTFAGLENLRML